MNEYPVIIKLNRYYIKVAIILPIVFIAVLLWVCYFCTDSSSYSLFVYIFTPLLILFGFALYFLVCKIYKTRLECFPDKIVIEKRNSSTIFLVKDTLRIAYSKSSWDCNTFEIIPVFYRTGNSIVIEDTAQDNFRFFANISYKEFCKLADMYPENVDEKYRANDIEKEL